MYVYNVKPFQVGSPYLPRGATPPAPAPAQCHAHPGHQQPPRAQEVLCGGAAHGLALAPTAALCYLHCSEAMALLKPLWYREIPAQFQSTHVPKKSKPVRVKLISHASYSNKVSTFRKQTIFVHLFSWKEFVMSLLYIIGLLCHSVPETIDNSRMMS